MSRQYYEVIRVAKRPRGRRGMGTFEKIKLVGMLLLGIVIIVYVVRLYAISADAAIYLPLVLR
jgi:hypothetical protein